SGSVRGVVCRFSGALQQVAYPPKTSTLTSLPLSAPARREAAPRLAEISRKPVLPTTAKSSPCAPAEYVVHSLVTSAFPTAMLKACDEPSKICGISLGVMLVIRLPNLSVLSTTAFQELAATALGLGAAKRT